MPKFTVEIECGNAAFDDTDLPYEIARILREIADYAEAGTSLATFTPVHDVNGNAVGGFMLAGG